MSRARKQMEAVSAPMFAAIMPPPAMIAPPPPPPPPQAAQAPQGDPTLGRAGRRPPGAGRAGMAASSTMLTGSGGVDPRFLSIGQNSLLGA